MEAAIEKNPMQAFTPQTFFLKGELKGPNVTRSVKKISELKGIFEDKEAFEKTDADRIAYEVDSFFPVEKGTEGGLFFGLTNLYPGVVNDEYFMTHGHFHSIENRAEYYWGIEGEGVLLLMDKEGNTRAEKMQPGTLHYIPGYTAHRVVNTGETILRFGACWPADAGHNYAAIGTEGFTKRVKKVNNQPVLI
jgi:glucose-6-phosphate isomerase, archaeal